MKKSEKEIREHLFALQDLKYKAFQEKLMPTVDPDRVIGVRMPALRGYAKEISGQPMAKEFLNSLPHHYYEENNLHGALLQEMKDYDEAMAHTEAFLPHIDNWATCDSFTPKVFKKHPARVYEKIQGWIRSEHTYTIRYGIGIFLSNFLDGEFRREMMDSIAVLRSEEYYVNMMIAWYFATALAKQPDAALDHIRDRSLDKWTHNKAIQKAIESYRISTEMKSYLRTLKIK